MIRRFAVLFTVLLITTILLAQKSDIDALKSKAEAGDPAAQASLGLMYRMGRGVPEDKAEAVKWYTKAAMQGHAGAMFNLATCFYNGDGVAISDSDAYVWFALAARAGNVDAAEALKRMESELSAARLQDAELKLGGMLEKSSPFSDPKAAVEVYRKLAEQDNVDAQMRLASMYSDGRGTPRDYAATKYWCEKASKSSAGMFCLGQFAQNGLAGPADPKMAAQWYSKAATAGHPVAMYRLGIAYEHGNGVKADQVAAYRWLNSAVQNNVAEAKPELEALEKTMSPKDLKKAKQNLTGPRPIGLVQHSEDTKK